MDRPRRQPSRPEGATSLDGADVIIIGGGIAGLAAANGLARAGVGRVLLLEREPVLCSHSSGRNAAIFRHLTGGVGDVELAKRSRALLTELLGSEEAWLQKTGAWFVSEGPKPLEALAALAVRERVACEQAKGTALESALPSLQGGVIRRGLFFPDDGVIDIHAVTQELARAATAAGVTTTLGADVTRIEVTTGSLAEEPPRRAVAAGTSGKRVTGVTLASGQTLTASAVVIAAGAWGEALGASCGAALSLEPRRRHLALLEPKTKDDAGAPIIWCVDDELYMRPDSGGLLASPCDEVAWKAELPAATEAGVELLAKKLSRIAPRLADAAVRRSWACLRTFAADRAPVVGADTRVGGLLWLAGLGGHGMTGGVAAGELLASTFIGKAHKLTQALAPARFLTAPS
jgi:glycine/D-amino acid oxidase-like deaminating enzyme